MIVGKVDSGGLRLIFWDLGGQAELHELWDKVRTMLGYSRFCSTNFSCRCAPSTRQPPSLAALSPHTTNKCCAFSLVTLAGCVTCQLQPNNDYDNNQPFYCCHFAIAAADAFVAASAPLLLLLTT